MSSRLGQDEVKDINFMNKLANSERKGVGMMKRGGNS
jgi:hypothetical protein